MRKEWEIPGQRGLLELYALLCYESKMNLKTKSLKTIVLMPFIETLRELTVFAFSPISSPSSSVRQTHILLMR